MEFRVREEFGKIERAKFGHCGYDDAMIGMAITISGQGWGVSTDITGGWIGPRSESAKWTEQDRINGLGNMALAVSKILTDAKVTSVSELVGKPVRCTFQGNNLKDWRIFTEVL